MVARAARAESYEMYSECGLAKRLTPWIICGEYQRVPIKLNLSSIRALELQ
jgi:hypothetical protein